MTYTLTLFASKIEERSQVDVSMNAVFHINYRLVYKAQYLHKMKFHCTYHANVKKNEWTIVNELYFYDLVHSSKSFAILGWQRIIFLRHFIIQHASLYSRIVVIFYRHQQHTMDHFLCSFEVSICIVDIW